MNNAGAAQALELAVELARAVAEAGREMGLPYVAASADIGSPRPMLDPDGKPFAETLFHWIDPKLEYWKDRGFALRSPLVHAARAIAEPFYFSAGRFATWRPCAALEAMSLEPDIAAAYNVGAAIIAPVYLPGGVIGAVTWASPDRTLDVAAVFETRAVALHALALKMTAAYHEATRDEVTTAPVRLTRREIQCLKWAAAGKTDSEVGAIVQISLPTVRFHITNASRKLGVTGRSQAVHRAATLGYIGSS